MDHETETCSKCGGACEWYTCYQCGEQRRTCCEGDEDAPCYLCEDQADEDADLEPKLDPFCTDSADEYERLPCPECDSTEYEEYECPECYELKRDCCEIAGNGVRCFACEELDTEEEV